MHFLRLALKTIKGEQKVSQKHTNQIYNFEISYVKIDCAKYLKYLSFEINLVEEKS